MNLNTNPDDKYLWRDSSHAILSGVFLCLLLMTVIEAKAQISVRGGNPTLNVTTAVAGSEPTPVVNTACTVRYSAQVKISKITVQTSCPNQKFPLRVFASSVPANRGVAAPEVVLQNGAPAADFITSIPTGWSSNANATLRYTAAPLFSQGTGTDTHTVTYTILAQ